MKIAAKATFLRVWTGPAAPLLIIWYCGIVWATPASSDDNQKDCIVCDAAISSLEEAQKGLDTGWRSISLDVPGVDNINSPSSEGIPVRTSEIPIEGAYGKETVPSRLPESESRISLKTLAVSTFTILPRGTTKFLSTTVTAFLSTSTDSVSASIPTGYSLPAGITHFTDSIVAPIGSLGNPTVNHHFVISSTVAPGVYFVPVEYIWTTASVTFLHLEWIWLNIFVQEFTLFADNLSVDFGAVTAGESSSSIITFTNKIERSLAVVMASTGSPFSIPTSDVIFALGAFGSRSVNVAFQPTSTGTTPVS